MKSYTYTQLTEGERNQIYALKQAGHKRSEIAVQVGRDKSTIGRELKRNSGLRGYRPKQAQRLADQRREDKVTCRISKETWLLVNRLVYEDWSPEQISGWLKKSIFVSVMNEFISMFTKINTTVELFIVIFVARKCEENVMEALPVAAASETGFPSTVVRRSWKSVHA